MNAIFTAGATVIRVGAPTAPPEAAIDLAGTLAAAGVRVTHPVRPDAVQAGELAATAWERIVPTGAAADWVTIGRAVARVHTLHPDDLPARYPLPRCERFAWWRFDALLDEVGPALDAAAFDGLAGAIERHRWWLAYDELVVLHGDVHPGNAMATADGTVLIDWDVLCVGPPAWDHAPMLTWARRWGGPESWYRDLAAGYGRSLAGDPLAEAIAELRLVAATLMRLRAGLADPVAMPEARARLAYWRGEPGAPPWHAM